MVYVDKCVCDCERVSRWCMLISVYATVREFLDGVCG